jgi:signal transduction histidine kinase
MFKKENKQSINQINVIVIIFAGIFAFTSAFIIIFNEFIEFKSEIENTEKDFLQNQKRKIVNEVLRIERLVNYRLEEYSDKDLSKLENIIAKEIAILVDDKGSSYLFIYTKDGRKIYESISHSNKNINNFLKVSKESGSFITFKTYKKVNSIAYTKYMKNINWVIGSGVNIDQIDRVLEQKKEQYRNKITSFILKIITLTLFLYLASILKYRYITDKISKEIRFIVESLKNTSKDYTPINRNKIKFKEFREITAQVNYMILKIKEKKKALEDLNQNLELLVNEKTKKLEKSVAYTKELLKEQDKFLKNAIHEINTPLSIIMMNIDLYNLKFDKNKYLTKIEAAVKVLENIYGDLSFIVKKDKVDSSVDMVNFTKFVADRIAYFEDVAIGNNLRIKSELEDDIFILLNEFELQRLCDNNISNAIKYSFSNEEIIVRLYNNESCTVFEIENIGNEIESVEKLFDRYYREDIARGGFGLGLNIVYEICQKNSIGIDVSSKNNKTIFRYIFECSRRISE